MFEITVDDTGTIHLSGRLDGAQARKAAGFLEQVTESAIVDLTDLSYISSAGIGVIMATFKRLDDSGKTLTLVNPTRHVRNVFRYAGLDQILTIE